MPDDSKWSLSERPGYLRLHSLPARRFLVGAKLADAARDRDRNPQPPRSWTAAASKTGDVAGLALLNSPYAWIGLHARRQRLCDRPVRPYHWKDRPRTGRELRTSGFACTPISTPEISQFSYSLDGKEFTTARAPIS